MRIEMYSARERCLYVHDAEFRVWFDDPFIRRGERLISIREKTGGDPAIEGARGLVFYSTEDPFWSEAEEQVEIRGGWLYFDVGSAEDFLDGVQVEWPTDDGGWRLGSLRDGDRIGVITGPVHRIVFTDLARGWPGGTRKRFDRTRRFYGRPRDRGPRWYSR